MGLLGLQSNDNCYKRRGVLINICGHHQPIPYIPSHHIIIVQQPTHHPNTHVTSPNPPQRTTTITTARSKTTTTKALNPYFCTKSTIASLELSFSYLNTLLPSLHRNGASPHNGNQCKGQSSLYQEYAGISRNVECLLQVVGRWQVSIDAYEDLVWQHH